MIKWNLNQSKTLDSWFLQGLKILCTPDSLSSLYCTPACLWVFASMINSISKYSTFKFPKRRLGLSACSVFSAPRGLKTDHFRSQISQLLFQSVLRSNGCAYLEDSCAPSFCGAARNTSWGLGNWDRELGKDIQERVAISSTVSD